MKRRWQAVVVAVDGSRGGHIARTFTRWGALKATRRYLTVGLKMYGTDFAPNGIPEPIVGRPLYSILVERIPS